MVDVRFAALGKGGDPVLLVDKNRKPYRQVLWGDYLAIEKEVAGGWLKVNWAPNDPNRPDEVYIRKTDTVEQRPLEIIFVDVGQGDGSVLITPERGADERIMVIDGGSYTPVKDYELEYTIAHV